MSDISIYYEGKLSTSCILEENGSKILTDAPKDNQGEGRYFSPTDLFATALGSCMITLMGIVAQKLGIDLGKTRATVHKTMVVSPVRRIGKISVHIYCPSNFDRPTQEKLEKAAKGCPVHHSLHPDTEQEIVFHWGES